MVCELERGNGTTDVCYGDGSLHSLSFCNEFKDQDARAHSINSRRLSPDPERNPSTGIYEMRSSPIACLSIVISL